MRANLRIIIILLFLGNTALWSQSGYQLSGYIIGSSGDVSTELSGTMGIPVVGMTNNDNYALAGFWAYVADVTPIESNTDIILPKFYELEQNFPNPFNPQTTIHYALPFYSDVTIEIFNVLGKRLWIYGANNQAPGYYEITWDAKNLYGNSVTSGIYFYRMVSHSRDGNLFVKTRKMMFMK